MPTAVKTAIGDVVRSIATLGRAGYEPASRLIPTPNPRLGPMTGVLDLIAGELARARRHERPFSLIHISLATALNGTTEHAAHTIRSTLRECDRMETDGSGIAILLTETGAIGAASCVERVVGELGIDPRLVRRASFPENGVTSGALCAFLEGRVDILPAPSDLPTVRGGDHVASTPT